MPDEPFVPEVPEEPSVADVPEEPEVPLAPEVPAVPLPDVPLPPPPVATFGNNTAVVFDILIYTAK